MHELRKLSMAAAVSNYRKVHLILCQFINALVRTRHAGRATIANVHPSNIQTFFRAKGGVIAVIFALAAIPIVMSIAAAIDFGRAYVVKTELGEALDKAALAVAVSRNATDEQIEAIFQGYFDANFPQDLGSVVSLSKEQTESTITLTATASVETAFLKVINVDTIEVSGTSTVVIETTGLEVALVLDNTGSMQFGSPSRISSLRTAANDLVDILFGEQTSPDNLKVALVPFVATVNIGNDDNSRQLVRFPDIDNVYPNVSDTEWKGCVEAREAPNDVLDIFLEGDATQGEWAPYYWEAEPVLVRTNGLFRACANLWWLPGFSLSSITCNKNSFGSPPKCGDQLPTGRSPTNFTDDIGFFEPSQSLFFEVDATPKTTRGPNQACPDPVVPLTNNKATLQSAIDQMQPWEGNGTMSHLGAAWGWRILSPEAPFQEGLPYSQSDNNKAMIILTDGSNLVTSQSSFCQNEVNAKYTSHYTAYGYTSEGRLGTNTSENAINTELNNRLLQVCTNIKDTGIIVYTITFDLDDSETQDLFQQCATDPTKYFNSPDGDTLRSAFQAIGAELSNLRISQ